MVDLDLESALSSQLQIPSIVRVKASQNGWMTADLYHWWLWCLYRPDLVNNLERHRLLLVDHYRPHISEPSKKILTQECNSDLIMILAGCTSLVQPMDVSVKRPFKVKMQEKWLAWFRQVPELTRAGNRKQPTRQDVLVWVSRHGRVYLRTSSANFL